MLKPYHESEGVEIHHSYNLDVLREMPDNSVHAIVTDPPYGLRFMGKAWDYQIPSVEVWKECLRVLKPGGHLLCFAGTRTQHRMAVNIEDAGFEIRDMIAWVYGSGFPKSLDVSKAIDKAAGAEREVVGSRVSAYGTETATGERISRPDGGAGLWVGSDAKEVPLTGDAVTDEAKEWEGFGTALKPALEPITVARKPFDTTVAANVLEHGTGAINIDGCRVEYRGETDPRTFGGSWKTDKAAQNVYEGGYAGENQTVSANGRFPANFIHDGSDEVLGCFPESKSGWRDTDEGSDKNGSSFSVRKDKGTGEHYSDEGSAARFFYCAKASRQERNAGCEDLEPKEWIKGAAVANRNIRPNNPNPNNHPTVKPLALMRYLVRLVTREGQIVLDPYFGSGSTGAAAVMEGRQIIGIEMEEESCRIAQARIAHHARIAMELEKAKQLDFFEGGG